MVSKKRKSIDPKKLFKGKKKGTKYGYTSVRYWMYKSDQPLVNSKNRVPEEPKGLNDPDKQRDRGGVNEAGQILYVDSDICFARMPGEREAAIKVGHNRITFELLKSIDFICEKSRLTKPRIKRYLLLAKKNKMLPKYVHIDTAIKTGRITLDLVKHSRRELFVYLTMFRTICHDADVVHAVVGLVDNYSLDFYNALVVAHASLFQNSNHSFLPGHIFVYPPREEIKDSSNAWPETARALEKVMTKGIISEKWNGGKNFGVDAVIGKHVKQSKNKSVTLEEFINKK